jgi:tetratricopeptide (TPR) repeat protein
MRAQPGVILVATVLAAQLAVAQPSNARQAFDRALSLERAGDSTAALSLLWEAAGLAPSDPDIQNALGEALERIGALDAAVTAFRAAERARPGFRKASNNLILALVKSGKGVEAVERARALVAETPADPDRQFTLGLALSEQDAAAAIAAFRRTLELAPDHALARYNLALLLNRSDRQREAIAELERLLQTDRRGEGFYTLGVIYWHQGDTARAADALRGAIKAQPDYADAYAALGGVLKTQRDFAGAAHMLTRAIELRPDLPDFHYALAQVLEAKGDAGNARAERDRAERLRRRTELEREAGVWTTVGTQKLDGGEAAASVDCFRRAIALVDTYAPAHYQLGRALQRLGKLGEARAAFARAHALNPALVAPELR